MSRIHTQLGILGALLIPAVAVALTTPNIFQAGDALSASELNENFAALEQEVNQLREDLQSAADRPSLALNSCQWIYETCDTSPCRANCPTGTAVFSGGCDVGAATGLVDSFGGPAAGAQFPPSPAPAAEYTRWACNMDGQESATAYALCCPVD